MIEDGESGPKTIQAIIAFQTKMELRIPDGLVEPGQFTMIALIEKSGGTYYPPKPKKDPPKDAPVVGTPSSEDTSIAESVGRKGINNEEDVQTIQELLVKNGENVEVDGKIGQQTIGAIVSVQTRIGMKSPDGLISPGKMTFNALVAGTVPPPFKPSGKYFSHPNASQVRLVYGNNAIKLNNEAEHLLKSILAASGNRTATVTSSLRTYYHQARVMIQYYSIPQMARLYSGGAELAAGRRKTGENIERFAKFLEQRDKRRGRPISRHIPGYAIDVVPRQNRAAYAAKAHELVAVAGSGVSRLIELGQLGEKVDHIEFTFKVT